MIAFFLLLPAAPASCLLLAAGWLCYCVRLGSVVKLTCLHHVFLIVIGAVPVDVHLHDELMLLAVVHVAWTKAQAVLTAQQGINRTQNFGQLSFKSDRVKSATGFFGEGL